MRVNYGTDGLSFLNWWRADGADLFALIRDLRLRSNATYLLHQREPDLFR